jgi:hypothetical protein
MKTIGRQIRLASCVVALATLLNISPILASGLPPAAGNKEKLHVRVEVTFTKWVTDLPNMAGLVSGDVGGGTFAGEVLSYEHTAAVDKIEALYHINGGGFQFTAHNFVTQNNLKGTAVINGVVTDGPLKGARVRGEYQVIFPCGVINSQTGGPFSDACFQGTLTIRAD